MKFTLPDQLPATVAELNLLAEDARAEIRVFQARAEAKDEFSDEDVARLEYLNDSYAKIDAHRAVLAESEQSHTERLSSALANAAAATTQPAAAEATADEAGDAATDADGSAAAEVVAEAEQVAADAAQDQQAVTASTPGSRPFANSVTATDLPGSEGTGERKAGWELLPSAPKYTEFAAGNTHVGIKEIAESIASVAPGTAKQKTGVVTRGGQDFATQAIAKLSRPRTGKEITDAQQLMAELDRVTSEVPGHGKVSAQALTAAGGWVAPSEQVYDFCAVPPAVNLISLPEVDISSRGGIRYPVESDMSALLTNFAFQQHFTETQLEAVDGGGNPTAVINWNEIPAPDQFIEFRLSAIVYAVKVGILHMQGWPESVEHDLERLMVRHQHGISWRTINEMVSGSGSVKVVPTDSVLGATTSILNGLAWQAINLRLDKGLDINAPIEGVAPVWLKEVIRADLAMRDGLDALEVTDARINGFLVERNIYLQYVDDWQTRDSGKPGNLSTMAPPAFADVLLYPAGTWFRSLNPVITFGVQYPMELLKYNQYSHGFFEDAIAVGKRCDKSINVRVPLCVNGAVGAREQIVCSGATVTKTVTISGSPTGGNFTLKFSANDIASGNIAFNAAASAVDTALTAIDDGVTVAGDITVAGGALPGAAVAVTYPAKLGDLQLGTNALTGGTSPTVTVA